MACPCLAYRHSDGDLEFDHERPYCRANGEFVSPVKADVCNERFAFEYETCEIYREHASDEVGESPTTG